MPTLKPDEPPFKSKFRACMLNNQALPGGATTKLRFNHEEFDVNNEYDEVTNYRFTAKKAGYYFVAASVMLNIPTNITDFIIEIWKNIEAEVMAYGYNCRTDFYNSVSASCVAKLEADDYLEVYFTVRQPVSLEAQADREPTFFCAHRLS